ATEAFGVRFDELVDLNQTFRPIAKYFVAIPRAARVALVDLREYTPTRWALPGSFCHPTFHRDRY
ncbi:MAG TPA: hypothetical protein VMF89_00450, partial [Polyangiales bacterium]|nr:hypothetical protein [Polyangiales bacterium]